MCIFCKIVNREIPSNLVKEDENFLAFHDINPKAPVHVLVIPKAHYDSFNDTPGDVIGKMGIFMQEVAKEIGIDQSGYRIISNIGDDGAQEVKHLHFHILGGTHLKWGHLADADPKDFL
ncbi:MAG: histidine triad nucleotide-binding protein [Sulfuricurvum sp.]|nr:histidine triad nucleotide-binding protein [Sulfuricurvum sp.]